MSAHRMVRLNKFDVLSNLTQMLTLRAGGWDKFGQQGLNDNYLAVWLNNSGINSYYIGKFLNSFGQTNLATPAPPKGWTNSMYVFQLSKYGWFEY